jgi:hypothetical protein
MNAIVLTDDGSFGCGSTSMDENYEFASGCSGWFNLRSLQALHMQMWFGNHSKLK